MESLFQFQGLGENYILVTGTSKHAAVIVLFSIYSTFLSLAVLCAGVVHRSDVMCGGRRHEGSRQTRSSGCEDQL